MARCIFCKTTTGSFTTREHVLPESLGGENWSILPDGLFCDSCQNKFGSEIEQQALGDYPFSFFRVFLGIPTKKGKPPWFDSWEGIISASLQLGTISYDPASAFEQALLTEKKTQIRLLAHPLKPDMICRFLLKIGIEVVAWDDEQDVFSSKFDEARYFALTGNKTMKWWYLQREKIDIAKRCFTQGITRQEWADGVNLEVVKLEDERGVSPLSLIS